jgi:hypothetical protein
VRERGSVALWVCAAVLVFVSAADASSRSLSIRLHFHRIAANACCDNNPQVAAAGRYVFYVGLSGQGTLIDVRTGTTVPLAPPACAPFDNPAFGGAWLMVDCGGFDEKLPAPQLYNTSTESWTSVTLAPSLQAACQSLAGLGGCGTVGVGSHWLKFSESCYHCQASYVLQNIQTGAAEPDPATPGGNVFDDLNSPTGQHRLCAPVSFPSGRFGNQLGSVAVYGQFVLSTGLVADGSYTDTYLWRCGSIFSKWLPSGPLAASDQVIVWGPIQGRLHGFYLPSERAFTIPDPMGATPAALTGRTLYLLQEGTLLLTTTLPHAPTRSG